MSHGHEEMLWRESAVETVIEVRRRFLADRETEEITIEQIAGRVLAEDIVAEQDIPNSDFATMDGYAFDATDNYPLNILPEETFPESVPPTLESGEAVEIATGAPLPSEANTVLKREEASVQGGKLHGLDIDPGTYTYSQGSNVSQGETLFQEGELLGAKDSILLGDLGYESVQVTEKLSVGILATGTEIHEGSRRDLDSQMLAGLVQAWGHPPTYEGTVPDEYDQVRAAVSELAKKHDVVVTTGGTSVGHKDYVIRVLEELGDLKFHRVRIRPGKPIALARLPDFDSIAFAIPGKPLGAYIISVLVMRPFFTGRTELPTIQAILSNDVDLGPEGFEYAIPVTTNAEMAVPLGQKGSTLEVYNRQFDPSVLSSSTRATRADGIILTKEPMAGNESASVIPLQSLE